MIRWADQMGFRNIAASLRLVLKDLQAHDEGARPITVERDVRHVRRDQR